jgi:dipeptidyl aminopeptidase/acylaminoacyl peptidase
MRRLWNAASVVPRSLLGRVLLTLALFLLVSCGGVEATPLPTVPAVPTATATPTSVPTATPTWTLSPTVTPTPMPTPTLTPTPMHPLTIEAMRRRTYPGSEIVIEETLTPGSNYDRAIASYRSEGLRIYALLTVPRGERPEAGWPVVVFNHGYIPPDQYRTTERYVAYVDGFARNGYIVFRPDYRGHGNSEGEASGAFGAPDYTVDVLNAVASLQRYPEAHPDRIGMWGHSMGGTIALRAMVVTDVIKAGVIWAGVVAPYKAIWESRPRWVGGRSAPTPDAQGTVTPPQEGLFAYGTFEENPVFWASIDPTSHLQDLSGPVQLHHGRADATVPVEFSQDLYARLQAAGRTAELYLYEGDNHNISNSFATAMSRSIEFFDRHLKGASDE